MGRRGKGEKRKEKRLAFCGDLKAKENETRRGQHSAEHTTCIWKKEHRHF